jgi:acyl transferase domain-containing protein
MSQASGPSPSALLLMDVGTFVGASSTDYNKLALRYSGGTMATAGRGGVAGGSVSAFSATGVSLSVAAGRVAFCFNLRGPAMTIDTGESGGDEVR